MPVPARRSTSALASLAVLTPFALGLGACTPVPCADNPAAMCYAPIQQPGAAAYGVPGAYPAAPDAYGALPAGAVAGPDGIPYVDGYPVYVEAGVPYPVVFDANFGGWGYYDGYRRWHSAPGFYRDRLDRFHPEGRGLPPPGGYRSFRGAPVVVPPVGGLRGGVPYGGAPYGGAPYGGPRPGFVPGPGPAPGPGFVPSQGAPFRAPAPGGGAGGLQGLLRPAPAQAAPPQAARPSPPPAAPPPPQAQHAPTPKCLPGLVCH